MGIVWTLDGCCTWDLILPILFFTKSNVYNKFNLKQSVPRFGMNRRGKIGRIFGEPAA